MQSASQAFQKGNLNESIAIYSSIIDSKQTYAVQALLNRASVYYSMGEYSQSLRDTLLYLQTAPKPSINGYIMFANGLIKTKAILQQEQRNILSRGKEEYPYHKKYEEVVKTLEDLQVTENQEEYMDKIFEKLLSVPTIRKYMSEESFLTKVEKMITNPSLAAALIKMDDRLAQVQEIILTADC